MGLIAQEVKEVAPEAVGETGGYYSLGTPNLVGLLVEAIKDQDAKMEKQQKDIEALKNENQGLKEKIAEIEQKLK